MAYDCRAHINGEWLSGKSRGDNFNPATGEKLGTYAKIGRAETTAAIDAAAAAYPGWRATPAPKRAEILWKALRLLGERKEEIATALTKEEGKSIADARGEVQKSYNVLEFVAGEGRRLNGETVPSEMPSTVAYTVREPL